LTVLIKVEDDFRIIKILKVISCPVFLISIPNIELVLEMRWGINPYLSFRGVLLNCFINKSICKRKRTNVIMIKYTIENV